MQARQILWSSEFVKSLTFVDTYAERFKNDDAIFSKTGEIVVPCTTGVDDSIFIAEGVATDKAGTVLNGVVTEDFDYITYKTIKRGFRPFGILEEDDTELTINGQNEKLAEKSAKLREDLYEVIGHEATVATSGNVLRTTGTTTHANKFANTVKDLLKADIDAADLKLDEQKVSKEGRIMLVTPRGYAAVRNLVANGYNLFEPTYNAVINGKVGMYMGYDVYMSHSLASFTSAVAKKPLVGAVDANTDLEAVAILMHPSFMRKNISDINVKISDMPGRYTNSSVLEGWARVGATPNSKLVSNTYKGIVSIVDGK